MTLFEFMQDDQKQRNQWLKHPDFKGLYVRKGQRNEKRCIDLANIEAKIPGNGAFTNLWKYLIEQGWSVYIENVLTVRFQDHLLDNGFVKASLPYCFIKES